MTYKSSYFCTAPLIALQCTHPDTKPCQVATWDDAPYNDRSEGELVIGKMHN